MLFISFLVTAFLATTLARISSIYIFWLGAVYLLVAYDKAGFPKSPASGVKTVKDGRFSVYYGFELGQGLPSSLTPLSFSHFLTGLLVQGALTA